MSSNMVRRVAFAVVAIPLLLGVVWLGGWPLAAVLMAAATLGIGELFSLAERVGVRPFTNLGRAMAVAVPLGLIAIARVPAASWLSDNLNFELLMAVLVIISTGKSPSSTGVWSVNDSLPAAVPPCASSEQKTFSVSLMR